MYLSTRYCRRMPKRLKSRACGMTVWNTEHAMKVCSTWA